MDESDAGSLRRARAGSSRLRRLQGAAAPRERRHAGRFRRRRRWFFARSLRLRLLLLFRTIAVCLADSPSALSVFSDVESLAPAATSKLLETRRAEQATEKLLRAAARSSAPPEELRRGEGERAEEGEGCCCLSPRPPRPLLASSAPRIPPRSRGRQRGFQLSASGKAQCGLEGRREGHPRGGL